MASVDTIELKTHETYVENARSHPKFTDFEAEALAKGFVLATAWQRCTYGPSDLYCWRGMIWVKAKDADKIVVSGER